MSDKYIAKAMSCFYEERAAILQYEAGLPKEKAEALAKAEMETWVKQTEAKQ